MNIAPFQQGIEAFNHEEFYTCHDILEAVWMDSVEPHKSFYQGILQIAVGCYHLTNLNWRGAVILLGEGTRHIRDYQPDYEGVNVTQLLEESLNLLEALQQIDPSETQQFLECLQSSNPDESLAEFPKILRVSAE